jgi:hypothetical protein
MSTTVLAKDVMLVSGLDALQVEDPAARSVKGMQVSQEVLLKAGMDKEEGLGESPSRGSS